MRRGGALVGEAKVGSCRHESQAGRVTIDVE